MDLGTRLKEARLAAGLSQKVLCGDTITRNMLSLIESGRANPSMDTLKVLSERLGKPISYFLEEETTFSPNHKIMRSAKDAFALGQYKDCLAALEDYQPDGIFDDEMALLYDLSLLGLAEKALEEDRPIYAKELLYRMEFEGLYQVSARKDRQQLLLAKAGENIRLASLDEQLLLQADFALQNGDYDKALNRLGAVDQQDDLWHLLRGQVFVAMENYEKALPHLLSAEPTFPQVVIPLLERCYQQLEDYKMAYAYALKARGGA